MPLRALVVAAVLAPLTLSLFAADKPPSGPIATVLRATPVYVEADIK
jgi:hypothetical protein